MYIILVYDINMDDGGRKILNKTFKICKRYLSHIQNSVFEGELSKAQIIKLESELKNVIRQDKDSIILFKSRNERWLDKEVLGFEKRRTSNFL